MNAIFEVSDKLTVLAEKALKDGDSDLCQKALDAQLTILTQLKTV